MNLGEVRREYTRASLDEATVERHPVAQFRSWIDEARRGGLVDPNAMTLATATRDGHPSARIVLLKAFDDDGFVFFTDYRSQKGGELEQNPEACLLFYWAELERQVRITGPVEQVPRPMSEAYFLTRPLGSQLGAWTSHQSTMLPGGRRQLEERLADVAERYAGGAVPCPPHWGGFRLTPRLMEFWQGREDRLHDRIRYARQAPEAWVIERLSP
ncbi:MAG: pyridoxamine 5'-phosphate oxidase [Gemmatimonadota bacterium]|jgi:pyridoxamine 5'-phosphate oxidase|nr:pyridoxamine 5'-phosphate oxidase [Gemmatimonadota bacterium]